MFLVSSFWFESSHPFVKLTLRMVSIVLNGEQREMPGELPLDQFLEHFDLPLQRIAVEVNREVVRRSLWPATIISNDDRIEVVHFVGGG